jgi:hypothetical protein
MSIQAIEDNLKKKKEKTRQHEGRIGKKSLGRYKSARGELDTSMIGNVPTKQINL